VKFLALSILPFLLSGCIMNAVSPDLSKANLFGCAKGERLKPTTRGMFGTNKGDAECLTPDDPRYKYYEEVKP
jgi:hypothetical protein